MRFRKCVLLNSLHEQRSEIRGILKSINSQIVEVQPDFADDQTLVIGTDAEVLDSYKTDKNQYMISMNCLNEIRAKKLKSIPLTEMNRYLISIALYNKFISFVGFREDDLFELITMVILLGGTVSPVSEDVDIVVSNRTLSWSHIKIRAYKVPIVTQEWLQRVYDTKTYQPSSDYLLPVFSGWIVTSTDLTPSDSKRLSECVMKNGGTWQSTYDPEVIFVVARNLLPTKKIWAAILSRVPVIHPVIIHDYASGQFQKPFETYVLNPWVLPDASVERIFDGFTFKISKDIPEYETLHEIVQVHGGRFGDPCTHYVVPHGSYDAMVCRSAVSVNWVLACAEKRHALDVARNVIYTPVPFTVPLPEIANKTFSLFHLDDSERPTLGEIVRVLGGTVVYRLHKSASYVIASGNDDKMMEWCAQTGVPALTPQFLVYVLRTGEVPDTAQFLIKESDTTRLEKLCQSVKNTARSVIPRSGSDPRKVCWKELETFTQEEGTSLVIQPTEIAYEQRRSVSAPELSQDPLFNFLDDEEGQACK